MSEVEIIKALGDAGKVLLWDLAAGRAGDRKHDVIVRSVEMGIPNEPCEAEHFHVFLIWDGFETLKSGDVARLFVGRVPELAHRIATVAAITFEQWQKKRTQPMPLYDNEAMLITPEIPPLVFFSRILGKKP